MRYGSADRVEAQEVPQDAHLPFRFRRKERRRSSSQSPPTVGAPPNMVAAVTTPQNVSM
jgi:hypothetical protein